MVKVSEKWARPTDWWRERGLSGLIKLAPLKFGTSEKLAQKKITNKNVKQLANNHVSTHPTTHLL